MAGLDYDEARFPPLPHSSNPFLNNVLQMIDSDSNNAPWYQNGLPFHCSQCGDCCTGSPGWVWVNEEEVRAIADYLDKPIGEIRLLYTRPAQGKISLTEYGNGDCVFFDPQRRGCTIYPVRPVQCRTWPFWEANLATPESWAATCQVCPGSGTGDLVPLEIIQQRLEQTSF